MINLFFKNWILNETVSQVIKRIIPKNIAQTYFNIVSSELNDLGLPPSQNQIYQTFVKWLIYQLYKNFKNNASDYEIQENLRNYVEGKLDFVIASINNSPGGNPAIKSKFNDENYNFQSFVNDAEHYHLLLQKNSSGIAAPGKIVIVSKVPGYYWVNLNTGFCEREGEAGGHCGNIAVKEGDIIFSLRKMDNLDIEAKRIDMGKKSDSDLYKNCQLKSKYSLGDYVIGSIAATFIINDGEDGRILGESKGWGNQKLGKEFHTQIVELLTSKDSSGEFIVDWIEGGGYKAENNFNLQDLNSQDINYIKKTNPSLIYGKIYHEFSNGNLISKSPKDTRYQLKDKDGNPLIYFVISAKQLINIESEAEEKMRNSFNGVIKNSKKDIKNYMDWWQNGGPTEEIEKYKYEINWVIDNLTNGLDNRFLEKDAWTNLPKELKEKIFNKFYENKKIKNNIIKDTPGFGLKGEEYKLLDEDLEYYGSLTINTFSVVPKLNALSSFMLKMGQEIFKTKFSKDLVDILIENNVKFSFRASYTNNNFVPEDLDESNLQRLLNFSPHFFEPFKFIVKNYKFLGKKLAFQILSALSIQSIKGIEEINSEPYVKGAYSLVVLGSRSRIEDIINVNYKDRYKLANIISHTNHSIGNIGYSKEENYKKYLNEKSIEIINSHNKYDIMDKVRKNFQKNTNKKILLYLISLLEPINPNSKVMLLPSDDYESIHKMVPLKYFVEEKDNLNYNLNEFKLSPENLEKFIDFCNKIEPIFDNEDFIEKNS